MKRLKVDAEDIAMCMEHQRDETDFYLDTETGETVAIPGEVVRALEEDELDEDLPAWERDLIPQAKEILQGSPRYVEIPVRNSHEAYNIMTEFANQVTDSKAQSKLFKALKGRGAFGRFKDALFEYPDMREQWFKFKADRDKEEVKDWLESIGIEMEE